MANTDYERALRMAKAELDETLKRRADIDRQIMRLKQTIEALAPLCESGDVSSAYDVAQPETVGVTQGIRQLLGEATVPLSTVQLRDGLLRNSVDLSDYANAMAVIHNTLKRLSRQGEVVQVPNSSGQIHYFLSAAKVPDAPESAVPALRMTVAMHP